MNIQDLFTDEEWLHICAHARNAGMKVSDYIRIAVLQLMSSDGYSPEEGEVLGFTVLGKTLDLEGIVLEDDTESQLPEVEG